MQRKMLLKRPIIPPISLSDIENGTDDDEMTQKRKVLRQESKKKRLNRAASKKQQFEDVLSKYTAHALQINDAVRNKSSIVKAHVSAGEGSREPQRRQVSSPVASQLAKKRKRSDTPCTSESDDGLVPENEVRAARKEARFWKAQYRLQCEHNTSLKNQLSFLQETVKAQLGSCKIHLFLLLFLSACCSFLVRRDLCINICIYLYPAVKHLLEEILETRVDKGIAGLLVEQPVDMASRTTSSGPQHVQGMAPNHDVEIGMSSSLHSAGIGSNCASSQDDEAHDLAEFSPTPDGRFHLCKGVKITADQAAKILRNKKATIVVCDTAQAIWGLEALALRTVSGRSVPSETTKQLTPAKVQVVQECLAYWGRTNNQDIAVAAHGVLRVLSEKIQDVKKKLKLGKE
ncbi:uncharacterized protein LOC119437365 isoform X2 [Dermacentor silvarum]|uniref:uncharacterized protein LOC119437365 isoform X2 n=1 Tax=Dermacentor silvarum TaxID=543639 RepID=UPI0021014E87|nr:uncharacterized protein LOC119437365 isoform X2 [Dermacentor silvarum]